MTNPRSASARVIEDVLSGHSLSESIPKHSAEITDPRDSGLVQEIAYGVMRNFMQLDALSRRLLSKPLKSRDRDVAALILIGLYQLLYLRVADHAAVHETAGAAKPLGKKWAVGLINGVLRNFQRQQESLLKAIADQPEVAYDMPLWLLDILREQWPDEWPSRVRALNQRPPMSLRVNLAKASLADYQQRLQEMGIVAEIIPYIESGLTLQQPMDVTRLPGFEQGWVSVQDGAAQLAAELLDPQPGEHVLDACAAPGGKSCHILERQPTVRLTAVDLSAERLQRVEENLTRLDQQAEVVVGDAAHPQGDWAERQYDRILLDVPCSATGVIRRHPDIKQLRRASDIPALVKLQGEILSAVWPLLKVGGRMLYVTCSILADENHRQLSRFLAEQPDAQVLPLEVEWGEASDLGRQILPGVDGMDGFFYAALVKQPQ
ncbi:MAG: 16S rRNA (cytosine(967)-C(5))-methyltransferase RsmB [Candidatus Thiodiazotropha lotti]|nr:16S rRNA (cytosine(967)-C(5))-methyltransferase RsmB [Candidatus Thiodiazotropha lotti]MCG7987192.1 16S rRNA (cytosine(967)-C(5))-methyltransferase RsmB [Candidatus Thiodiazotropha lotti]MCG8005608.1 16S rRNA (cytosine(967)-C(5))-methyltransferase RsmB [Candidatus Thiodiazotropha lotti]MCW4189237.1 16S rRNA (cytosine(967)-C(5))-methyltransferase RsmB [Candidatus Thiodiazotropha lotti]MCW4215530.1 16S rRNA (cytosine(967)-C(5))-methyltransferase RsmB [Candidatus Thiodiazotropha lotti]